MAQNEINRYELKIVFSTTSDEAAQLLRDQVIEFAGTGSSTDVTEHRLNKVTKL